MKKVSRSSLKQDWIKEMFKKEKHHNHAIEKDEEGTLRWVKNIDVVTVTDNLNLNLLWMLFDALGMDKNTEFFRRMYRGMGYSLYGYWELFYWESNNPEADKYDPGKTVLEKYDTKLIIDALKLCLHNTGSIDVKKGKQLLTDLKRAKNEK